MIKYLWIVILIIVHILAIGYVAYDVKKTYEYSKKHNYDLYDFLEELNDAAKVIVVFMIIGWFVVSLVLFAFSYGGNV